MPCIGASPKFIIPAEQDTNQGRPFQKLSRQNTLHRVFRMCGGLKDIGFDVPDENQGVSVRLKLQKLMREQFRERICPKL
jgi:hypothetical protein